MKSIQAIEFFTQPTLKFICDTISGTQIDVGRYVNSRQRVIQILNYAQYHRMVFPLLQAMKKQDSNAYVDQLKRKLLDIHKQNSLRTLLYSKAICDIQIQFEANQIPCIFLKGIPLSAQLYGDSNCRMVGDIDCWIPEEQFHKAHRLLCDLGYSSSIQQLSPFFVGRYKNMQNEVGYQHKNGVKIELHWSPFSRSDLFPFSFEHAFKQSKEICVHKCNIHVLEDSINILYLMLHGSSHLWERLNWLYDVWTFLESKPDSLIQVRSYAAQMEISTLPDTVNELCCSIFDKQKQCENSSRFRVSRPLLKLFAQQINKDPLSRPEISFWNLCRYHRHLKFSPAYIMKEIYVGLYNPHDWKDMKIPDFFFYLIPLLRFPKWLSRRFKLLK